MRPAPSPRRLTMGVEPQLVPTPRSGLSARAWRVRIFRSCSPGMRRLGVENAVMVTAVATVGLAVTTLGTDALAVEPKR